MSWESGNQLQTTASPRGSSQPYMEVRLASRASRDRATPLGVPVLPDVNCTKRPGASSAPEDIVPSHPLNGWTATDAVDKRGTSAGSHRSRLAPVREHIWAI